MVKSNNRPAPSALPKSIAVLIHTKTGRAFFNKVLPDDANRGEDEDAAREAMFDKTSENRRRFKEMVEYVKANKGEETQFIWHEPFNTLFCLGQFINKRNWGPRAKRPARRTPGRPSPIGSGA